MLDLYDSTPTMVDKTLDVLKEYPSLLARTTWRRPPGYENTNGRKLITTAPEIGLVSNFYQTMRIWMLYYSTAILFTSDENLGGKGTPLSTFHLPIISDESIDIMEREMKQT